MPIQGLHHAAYRCKNARETVEFYNELLGMDFAMAMSEDRVPSTKEESPYMHIFFTLGSGFLAFFEIPESPPMGRDPNTPDWVQHIAMRIDDMDELAAIKQRLEARGIDVIGPIDHVLFKSIYFFDPNGHRLELTVSFATPDMMKRLRSEARPMLEEWDKTRKVVRHAAWVHENEFA